MRSNKTKQIRATAKQAVAEVLSQPDESGQKEKIEEIVEGFQTELTDLSDAKAAVEEENKTVASENETLRSANKDLEDKVASLEKELSELKKQFETVELAKKELETKLSDMEQDAAMQKRVAELEEAGLLTSGIATDKMKTRIKKMDEEEFADYKAELVTFKSAWEKTSAQAQPEGNDTSSQNSERDADESGEGLSPKATAAQLLKLKRQVLASLNVTAGVDDGTDLISEDMKKEIASMWDDEKEEK